jgi:hypothetical protein
MQVMSAGQVLRIRLQSDQDAGNLLVRLPIMFLPTSSCALCQSQGDTILVQTTQACSWSLLTIEVG